MARYICGRSVRGASHARSGMPCQDSMRIEELTPELSIIAVADGHGSEKSPRSDRGSTIAVNVFYAVMNNYLLKYAVKQNQLITYMNRDGQLRLAQEICEEWQKRVKKSYNKSIGRKPNEDRGDIKWEDVYKLYGTTLLGLLITREYVFAFQIGDGDMFLINKDSVSPIVETEKILGTETHSLCKKDAWKKAVTAVLRRGIDDNKPYMYMMTTDGFINSYTSDEEHKKSCREYFDMIQTHGFDAVSGNMEKWLKETSELGCGDDITMVLVYVD